MSGWRGIACAAIVIAATLATSPQMAASSQLRPQYPDAQLRPVGSLPPEEDTTGIWWGITIVTAVLAWLIGRTARRGPSKQAVRDAIDAAFKIRKDEADTHAKPKLTKPLDAAHKATIKALEKLDLA